MVKLFLRQWLPACAAAAAVTLAVPGIASAAISSSEATRLTESSGIIRDLRPMVPADLWSRARCIAVIPDLKKAAFVFGGEYGKGVMSCRAGDRWSAPAFLQLIKGSWGFQVGAEQVDLVLLVMNESGVQKLLRNKVSLGADASIAAGPIGRNASASTDAQLTAEILSYSRAQGLFAGIDLSGGVLRPDDDANHDVYGRDATPRTILASSGLSAPTEATAFLDALNTVGGPTATAAAAPPSGSTAPAASAQPPATTSSAATLSDGDVRARLAAMEQTLDRVIADASPTPNAVGTSGSTEPSGTTVTGGATLTVDRARLMQLRQELDALIIALNQRQR